MLRLATRLLAVAVLVVGAGCSDESAPSSTSGVSQTQGGSQGTGASTSGATGTGTTGGLSGPGDCAELTTQEDCEAAIGSDGPGEYFDCSWVNAIPITLEGTTCSFGESVGVCLGAVTYDDDSSGVDGTGICQQDPDLSLFYRDVQGQVALVSTYPFTPGGFQMCTPDGVDAMPPECICGCDPGFPG